MCHKEFSIVLQSPGMCFTHLMCWFENRTRSASPTQSAGAEYWLLQPPTARASHGLGLQNVWLVKMRCASDFSPSCRGFDISVLEIFWPLCFGFSLFIASVTELHTALPPFCNGWGPQCSIAQACTGQHSAERSKAGATASTPGTAYTLCACAQHVRLVSYQ